MIRIRLNGFRGKQMAHKFRICSSTGWPIRPQSQTSFLHKIPVSSSSVRIRKVVIYDSVSCASIFPVIDFIPLNMPLCCLLVWCDCFIQPFSLPLFSTYQTGESHREVKFNSLWEEEMRERFAFIIKRYRLCVFLFRDVLSRTENSQWIFRCQYCELRYVGSTHPGGHLDSCALC